MTLFARLLLSAACFGVFSFVQAAQPSAAPKADPAKRAAL